MIAAVLPSREEPRTIANVAAAVASAIATSDSILVNVDASSSEETGRSFLNVVIPSSKRFVRLTEPGKGRQIISGLSFVSNAECVLVVDTDTTNPDASTYMALKSAIECGADLAIADYPRFWYEGNLSNHVLRPLLNATVGVNIPQPIAGDIALSHRAVTAILEWHNNKQSLGDIQKEVNGYGIDVAILVKCLEIGKVTSVRVHNPKRHAVSFPHFRQIFFDEVPVLFFCLKSQHVLHNTYDDSFRIDGGPLDHVRYQAMLSQLGQWCTDNLVDDVTLSWPQPLSDAWHSVQNGANINVVTGALWPAYVQRVIQYLIAGQSGGVEVAQGMLADGLRDTVNKIRSRTGTHFKLER